jgi:hypothetical protein
MHIANGIYSRLQIITFILLFNTVYSVAQPLTYSNLSPEEAFSLAKKSKQLVFMQLEGDCESCNKYAGIGLSGEEVQKIYKNFICIKVAFASDDYNALNTKYHFYPGAPTSLFVNADGDYLSSLNNQSTSYRNQYISLAAQAMTNEKSPPYKTFEAALSKKEFDKAMLKQYITLLTAGNFNTQDLLDKYLNELTIKDFESKNELLFLIRCCPLINSKTYQFIHLDQAAYNNVFMELPEAERISINQRIIATSKTKAFREKNRTYLYQVSHFLQGSYGSNYKEANKATSKLELEFAKEVKDYKAYFRQARNFYNSYLEKLNMDSVRTKEMNNYIKRPDGTILKGGYLYETANTLNNIAYTIYENSTDEEQLGFALKLSAKTLDYHVVSFYDTYARILYRLGGKKDAVDWQEKAIQLGDSLNINIDEFKEVLAKMRNNTL